MVGRAAPFRFALVAVSAACSSTPTQRTGGSGGAGNVSASGGASVAAVAGTSSAAGAGGASGGSGAGAGVGGSSGVGGAAGLGAGAGGVAAEFCPEAPTPRLASGTVLELPVELTFDGAPLLFAEANPLP